MNSSFKQNDPVLPLFFPSAMINFLSAQGHTTQVLLANTGIQEGRLLSPDSRASFRQVERIIINCEAAFDKPNLGLHFGQSLSLLSLGMLGQAAMASETVGDGLETITHYLELRDPLLVFSLEAQKHGTWFVLNSPIQLGSAQRFIAEAAFSAVAAFARQLASQALELMTYEFADECSSEIASYQRFLSEEVKFECKRDAIFIPNTVLKTKVTTANQINLTEAKQYLDLELSRLQLSLGFTEIVRTLVTAKLKAPPTEKEVAKTLGYSERNMRRRLASEGTNYRKLLGDIRQQIAETLLLTTTLKIEGIANELGYKNVGNFCRAFKRRSGITPSALRRESTELIGD